MGAIAAADRRTSVGSIARGSSIDPVELAVLALFALLGMWVLGANVYEIVVRGAIWTGSDGLFAADQLQYLAWIRDASQHLLAANLFVLRPTPHDYLQPMIAISGGLVALGMAPWFALLIWQPVALAVVLIAVRAFVHRTVTGVGGRRCALAVALFAGTNRMFDDLWLPLWTWGYPFALVALGAAFLSLLRYERARATGRLPVAAAALAGLAGWLHPWQGEVVIVTLVGAEAVLWLVGSRRPHVRSLLLVVGAGALPLVYYSMLHHFDPSWRMAAASDTSGLPLSHIALWLWPLLVPAALAYRFRPLTISQAAVRTWPFAAVACYLVNLHSLGSDPFHAFMGVTVPLAVLCAQGLQSVPWPRGVPRTALAVAATAAITVPVVIHHLRNSERLVLPRRAQSNFMPEAEADALQYIAAQPGPGGVLTDERIGLAVPAATDRRVYIGDEFWSQPAFAAKRTLVDELLMRRMSPPQARAFVLNTGARFLISDCWVHHSLDRLLGPIVQSSHAFGCDTVYTIRTT